MNEATFEPIISSTEVPSENDASTSVYYSSPQQTTLNQQETHIYKKRFIILFIFVMLSASNALQWIEYSIIAHIIKSYYNVSYSAVDWTSMIYMVSYMILVFPGRYFDLRLFKYY